MCRRSNQQRTRKFPLLAFLLSLRVYHLPIDHLSIIYRSVIYLSTIMYLPPIFIMSFFPSSLVAGHGLTSSCLSGRRKVEQLDLRTAHKEKFQNSRRGRETASEEREKDTKEQGERGMWTEAATFYKEPSQYGLWRRLEEGASGRRGGDVLDSPQNFLILSPRPTRSLQFDGHPGDRAVSFTGKEGRPSATPQGQRRTAQRVCAESSPRCLTEL